MAHFPSFGPFYDPDTEQEVYGDQDGSLIVRKRPPPRSANTSHIESGNNARNNKIESSWQDYVHPDQGDLFFVGDDGNTRGRSNSLPRQSSLEPSPLPDRKSGLSRQDEGRHSDSAVPPRPLRLLRGSASEEDEEEKRRSSAELRRKSKQLQQALQKKRDQPRNGEIHTGGRYRKSRTNQLQSSPVLLQKNNSRQLLSQSHNRGGEDVTNQSPHSQKINGVASPKNAEQQRQTSMSHSKQSSQQANGRQLKDIILVPDFHRRSESTCAKASGAELFELLLGIVLCRYTQRSGVSGAPNGDTGASDTQRENKDRKVVVQGVVAGSPADKSASINRGDMLLYLNGQEVTWSNLDGFVRNIKGEVKLTFRMPKIIGPTSCSGSTGGTGSSRLPAYQNLCLLVSGHSVFSLQQQLLRHKCVALYLTFTSSEKEKTPHDDIVYSFPSQEEPLTAIRGLFLTLSSSLRDAVQSGAECSSLVIGEEVVNAVYHRHEREVFILAAPSARVPLCVLRVAMSDTCRMLCAVFGGVDRAFHVGESGQLDQVFALLFHRLLGERGTDGDSGDSGVSGEPTRFASPWQRSVDSMCAVPFLQLVEENKIICDEILSEFESVDFDDFLEEQELYARRSYVVLGTSLFYENYLVCSHLHPSDLQDVHGFLRCHCLLTLASRQSVDQLVVWQEVHLSRLGRTGSVGMETGTLGYKEPTARWFMLIVGMKRFLLVTLLEAGGCSQEALGRPGPHPLLVDQARATLVQLDTDEVHMSSCCQDKLTEDMESTQTTSAERFVVRGRSSKEDGGTSVKSPVTAKPPSPGRGGGENPFKYRSSPRSSERRTGGESEAGSEAGAMIRQGSKLSYGSNDSGGSGSSAGASKNKASRFSSLLDMSAIGRSMSTLHIDTVGSQAALGKVTRGRDNVLFHYIHYNDLESVLVASSDLDLALTPGSVQSEVMSNFHRCVLEISSYFKQRDDAKEQELESPFECESSLTQTVQEHGVLFHCCGTKDGASDQKSYSQLGYWVVGRRFSTESTRQSFYVCFHESSNQALVEMAFALGFGT